MRIFRVFAVALLVVSAWAYSVSDASADVFCQSDSYNSNGWYGCYCTCSDPDSCGGTANDCTIGGFDDTACSLCYAFFYQSSVLYCFEHEAEFLCQA
jgi:hypothetical protein